VNKVKSVISLLSWVYWDSGVQNKEVSPTVRSIQGTPWLHYTHFQPKMIWNATLTAHFYNRG